MTETHGHQTSGVPQRYAIVPGGPENHIRVKTEQVAGAIVAMRNLGCDVPVVWKCGAYESVEVLRLLEGLVEIYMPDFKWADAAAGKKYSGVPSAYDSSTKNSEETAGNTRRALVTGASATCPRDTGRASIAPV
jgi:uncharacterized Fe-S radical SAM superfamily protein PflX